MQYAQVPQPNSGQQPIQPNIPQQGQQGTYGHQGNQGAGRGAARGRGGKGGRGRGNNRTGNQNNNQRGGTNQNRGSNPQGAAAVAGAVAGSTGNTGNTGNGAKCQICGGKHKNLIYCAQLPRYLPYGNNALEVPRNLCAICMSTEHQDARNCQHESSKLWRLNYCDAGNRCFILCKDCPAHLPALDWFSKNHKPDLGFKSFQR